MNLNRNISSGSAPARRFSSAAAQDLPAFELFVFGVLFFGAKTTSESAALIEVIAGVLFLASAAITTLRINVAFYALTPVIAPLAAFLLLTIWGGLNSEADIDWIQTGQICAAALLGGLAAVTQKQLFVSNRIGSLVIAIAALFLGATIYAEGLIFEGVPAFRFEVTNDAGQTIVDQYSQGVTKLLALLSVVTAAAIRHEPKKSVRYVLAGVLFVTFFLSLLGGARGEFIALVLVIAMIVFRSGAGVIVAGFMVLTVLLFALPESALSDLVLFNRMENLLDDDTLGGRSFLIGEAINLLSENPRCILIGCGLDYFKNYYGTVINYHPHNYIIELIICGGIFTTSAIYYVYFKSCRIYIVNILNSSFGFVAIYLFIVALKSGSIALDHIFWAVMAAHLKTVMYASPVRSFASKAPVKHRAFNAG